MRYRTWLGIVAALLVGRSLLAQAPESERTPITDPDRLERLGFPRDARNVFEWSKLDRSGPGLPDAKSAAAPGTWGTQTGFTTVLAVELQKALKDSDLQRNIDLTFCTNAAIGGAAAYVQVQLPEGASLGNFNSWMYDANPDRDLAFQVYEICQDYGYGDPVTTLIAENSTLGSIGNIPGSKDLGGLTVDNHHCAYSVRVLFAEVGASCVVGLGARKFEITWNRQVSPAPATATFGDVPTGHQFFQFIEALAKSGITGGCSITPPLFCPDQPLTRGQMAAFLAKGLGLQWPLPQSE